MRIRFGTTSFHYLVAHIADRPNNRLTGLGETADDMNGFDKKEIRILLPGSSPVVGELQKIRAINE